MPIDPSAADIYDAVHAVSPEMQRVIASVTAKAQADPIGTAHEHLRHLVGAIELSDETFLERGTHVRILTYEARAVADVLDEKGRTPPPVSPLTDAAPDLLAALNETTFYLRLYCGNLKPEANEAMARAQAAIAKARGGA